MGAIPIPEGVDALRIWITRVMEISNGMGARLLGHFPTITLLTLLTLIYISSNRYTPPR